MKRVKAGIFAAGLIAASGLFAAMPQAARAQEAVSDGIATTAGQPPPNGSNLVSGDTGDNELGYGTSQNRERW